MIEIKKGTKNIYVGDSEDTPLAEMIFTIDGDVITIEHTNISEELSGKGVGKLLLKEMVDWARRDNKKITPVCPYAKAQMEKGKEYHDVLLNN